MKISVLFKIASLLSLTLLLGACKPGNESPEIVITPPAANVNSVQEDRRLAAFFDEVFERNVSQSPEFQAYLGRKTEDYGRWDDFSDEQAQRQNQQTAADL